MDSNNRANIPGTPYVIGQSMFYGYSGGQRQQDSGNGNGTSVSSPSLSAQTAASRRHQPIMIGSGQPASAMSDDSFHAIAIGGD
ncbi:hypothetical protein EC988_007748, partial [Linderina pennispora]